MEYQLFHLQVLLEHQLELQVQVLSLIFPITTGIIKKILNIYKILMLAKNKLNSIETLISQALIDMETSHEEFITILNEKDKIEDEREDERQF